MRKKLILIMLFSVDSVSESQTPPAQSNDLLYQDILSNKLWNKNKVDIDTFLLDHQLSIQEFYTFLIEKDLELIGNSRQMIHQMEEMKPRREQVAELLHSFDLLHPFITSDLSPSERTDKLITISIIAFCFGVPWLIGIPSLLLGARMQRTKNITPIKNAFSWMLIAAGGILSLPGNIIALGTITGPITRTIESALLPLLPLDPKEKRRLELCKMINEIDNTTGALIYKLQELYPELPDRSHRRGILTITNRYTIYCHQNDSFDF